MALFFIVALQNSAAAIDIAIDSLVPTEERYKVEAGKWVVSMEHPTSKGVSDALKLSETQSHIVLPIRGYFGRAQPDLWEWLAAKSAAKVNG